MNHLSRANKSEKAEEKKETNENNTQEKPDKFAFVRSIANRAGLIPFGLSMALMVFQQWCGVNAVIFYTVTIFDAANAGVQSHLATNIVGITQLVATFCKFTN